VKDRNQPGFAYPPREHRLTFLPSLILQWEVRDFPNMAEPREVMNIRQASQYLGVSPDTLYRYVYQDKIPAFKLGNRWKFKKTVLDRWMEKQMIRGSVKYRRT
jgi:excisionase family DNA binding protein